MSGPLLLGAASVVAALVGWLSVSGIRALRRQAAIRRRMSRLSGILAADQNAEGPANTPAPALDEGQARRDNWLLAALNARYPLVGGVRVAIISAAAGMLCFFAMATALQFFGMAASLAYAASALMSGALAWNVGTVLEDARRSLFSSRFLVILDDLQRMVRYGISGHQALASAAAAAEEPVKASLNSVLLAADFGVSVGDAMDREARRTRVTELLMLAAVFSTQASAGGNLSESIDNLSNSLRARLDNRAQMKAATAESRITMIILAMVPFAGVGLQVFMQPELVDELLGAGRHLLGIGIGFIIGGLLVSWMMIRSAQR